MKQLKTSNKPNCIVNIAIVIIVGCIAWFLGSATTEVKMLQEIEQLELQYTEEISNLTNQYSEETYELNNEHYEEINKLQEQINEYEEETYELQNKINELEDELKQKETEAAKQISNNTNSYSYNNNSYDGDNDGDDQYDNEYADADDIYIDENGIIIYDKYGTNRNSNFNSARENVTTNEPTQAKYYYTSGGKSYHNNKNCPTLSRSKNVQYGQTSKADPCNMCCK